MSIPKSATWFPVRTSTVLVMNLLKLIRVGSLAVGLLLSSAAASEVVVVYSFKGGSDGANTLAGLVNVNSTLYGTTSQAGAIYGGTAFKITTAGVMTVLHSFGGGGDGAYPVAPLIELDGALYGTTQYGGTTRCDVTYANHCGTVFKITATGEMVLHSFTGGSDGATPVVGLIVLGSTLYGTTANGGHWEGRSLHSRAQWMRHRLQHNGGGCGNGAAFVSELGQ